MKTSVSRRTGLVVTIFLGFAAALANAGHHPAATTVNSSDVRIDVSDSGVRIDDANVIHYDVEGFVYINDTQQLMWRAPRWRIRCENGS